LQEKNLHTCLLFTDSLPEGAQLFAYLDYSGPNAVVNEIWINELL